MLFHLQTKERDEPRPRAGVLRTREFTMKDAYSFDRDEEGLARSYELQSEAYERIFDRCGLRWYRVESDVGMMGGSGAHEYMAPCPAGENEVALAPGLRRQRRGRLGRAAAGRAAGAARRPGGGLDPRPDQGRGGRGHARPARRGASSRPCRSSSRAAGWSSSCSAATTGSTRSSCATGWAPTSARPAPRRSRLELGPVGYLGPVGAGLPIIKDAALTGDSYVSGANKPDTHLRGIDPARDFESYEMDVRSVEAGDTAPGGGTIEIETAIEIGNIFKLGTRYSEPLGATYLDEEGKEHPIVMGSYGIGPARIAAAAIEQGADEKGIVWPPSIAPWQRPPGLARQGGGGGARRRRPHLRGAARALGRRGPLRRPRRRAGGEADRRRAARLPAAGRGRPPRTGRGRRGGDRARRAAPSTSCRLRRPPSVPPGSSSGAPMA